MRHVFAHHTICIVCPCMRSSVSFDLCWYYSLNSWSVWVLWTREPKSPRTHASMHPCTDESPCTDEPISIGTHEAKYEIHSLFGRTTSGAAGSHSVLWPLFRRTAFGVAEEHFQFCSPSLVGQCSEQRGVIQFCGQIDVYVCICMYMHVYVCICMYMFVYVCICIICMHMYVYVCMCMYMYVYVCTCMHMCTYECICVCICVISSVS